MIGKRKNLGIKYKIIWQCYTFIYNTLYVLYFMLHVMSEVLKGVNSQEKPNNVIWKILWWRIAKLFKMDPLTKDWRMFTKEFKKRFVTLSGEKQVIVYDAVDACIRYGLWWDDGTIDPSMLFDELKKLEFIVPDNFVPSTKRLEELSTFMQDKIDTKKEKKESMLFSLEDSEIKIVDIDSAENFFFQLSQTEQDMILEWFRKISEIISEQQILEDELLTNVVDIDKGESYNKDISDEFWWISHLLWISSEMTMKELYDFYERLRNRN